MTWSHLKKELVVPTSPAELRYDVVVLGAGPAGLAAAASASRAGARVALLDSAARPGGQYWRNRGGADTGKLPHDWSVFLALQEEIRGQVDQFPGHSVWRAEPGVLRATSEGTERTFRAAALIVATGAYDRQIPFPGWTLPGVFTAGGVQALLKGHGVVAGRRIAVAGTGPFLLAVAAGLAETGADVVGVYEAGHPGGFARFPGALARNAAKLTEGAGFLATLAKHRIPYHWRTAVVAAHGEGELQHVTTAKLTNDWQVIPGTESEMDCDTLAVGYGFTPQLEIPLQLGCETRLDVDGSLVAVADARQRSTTERVYLAGEVCGVGGAAASVAEGHLAGLAAAEDVLGRAPEPQRLRSLLRQRRALRSFARAMHSTFPVPAGWTGWMTPDTTVCRCEEVDARTVDAAIADLGAADPRAVKLFARPGMGLCQGRVCGYATACLVAARAGRAPTENDLRSVAARPIASPVTLGMIAAGRDA
ncbi:NAD(P)/FAD-dependent oxidoreductase [Amycolatopsis benzoatilytica]|uniref:FAD/NAD(P)-dependent oxidoreductase n=1 Tax=Amycolatopsis benzoatilytica TaxID=346045 RepID=UPI001B7FA2FD|nr:FAD/NAD(P)-binding oxidoreductase [Amycolatopsis benzoatilytica]